jgi:hypothetical protein
MPIYEHDVSQGRSFKLKKSSLPCGLGDASAVAMMCDEKRVRRGQDGAAADAAPNRGAEACDDLREGDAMDEKLGNDCSAAQGIGRQNFSRSLDLFGLRRSVDDQAKRPMSGGKIAAELRRSR